MGARLFAEEDRRVLWLSEGRNEVAVSATGVILRRGRAEVQLGWQDITQVQVSKVPLWPLRAWVDVFTASGEHRVGPFPRNTAEMWTAACGGAARDAGFATLAITDSAGFALRPSG